MPVTHSTTETDFVLIIFNKWWETETHEKHTESEYKSDAEERVTQPLKAFYNPLQNWLWTKAALNRIIHFDYKKIMALDHEQTTRVLNIIFGADDDSYWAPLKAIQEDPQPSSLKNTDLDILIGEPHPMRYALLEEHEYIGGNTACTPVSFFHTESAKKPVSTQKPVPEEKSTSSANSPSRNMRELRNQWIKAYKDLDEEARDFAAELFNQYKAQK